MPDYHARKSPSGMKARMLCPGKDNLCAKVNKKQRTNRAAALGTVAHSVGEDSLNKNNNPEDYYFEERIADGITFTVDDNMVDAVTQYTDYIRETIEEYESEGYTVKLFVEVWGPLEHWEVPGMEGGTSDCVLVIFDGDLVLEIIIIDYKHGEGVIVSPEWNPQLLCYAEGTAYLMKHDNGFKVNKNTIVRTVIVQPRSRDHSEAIKEWELTYGKLIKYFKKELIPAVLLSCEPDAPLVPGDEQCRWCDAKEVCPALFDKTQELAIVDFDDLIEPQMPKVETLTHEQKVFIANHKDLIKGFMDAVIENMNHEMQSGVKYDGFKLVRAKTNRGLMEDSKDPDFSPLLDHLSVEEAFTLKPRGIGELERTLTKKLGKEKAREVMSANTTKADGAIVMAPTTDNREEYASAVEDFKNVKH